MTKTKKILILLGNPDTATYTGVIADTYERSAREAGNEVQRFNIGELQFDPILHKGYKEIQALEQDLVTLQEAWKWADHVVIVYPNWWNTMPAILKGLFDRMWLPGFAFNFDKVTKKLIQRLKGKTARVIIVAGTHSPFSTWWKYGDYTNEIQHGILEFSGIKTKVTAFGPTERVDDVQRAKWCKEVEKLGSKGA
ncbi:flavodoxin family protein [Candidatus Parcubacteria bacterium]|uniref:NADPH:quinone reductase n=1 Tax=Candidatus Kaiserbacteria bacterium CG10_big_fil_rev_8_21_14_0_10_47_16 TaxID=1974608 RepID=A0A2H0UFA1_9BACT|nr:flavodoxin family protein [Candidatus Parcubacteria bacterium]PIR84465.1 MAG: NADPH:quinone reductase [Candidatus Kaiserbacteria bacterium CG10_big_fil_rev_8_21_14_0_10_47_16]